MQKQPWPKSPPELVDRFNEAIGGLDGVEPRKMFGFPAIFVGGNLTASLFGETVSVRLPPDELKARLDAGWAPFEPMPGRPMRDYVALPSKVASDAAAMREWIAAAVEYVRTLPPKEPKPRKR